MINELNIYDIDFVSGGNLIFFAPSGVVAAAAAAAKEIANKAKQSSVEAG